MNDIDPIKPADSWTFHSREVANDFTTHVNAQLPWYDLTSDAVALAVRQFLPEGGKVYEVGCSNGNIARRIKETIDARKASFLGVDNSAEMFDTIRVDGDTSRILFQHADAAAIEFEPYDVFVSMLTSIFINPSDRFDMIWRAWSALRPGGAMIFVERFEQGGGEGGQLKTRMTINAKRVAGVSDAQIAAKEFSLVGVQRPMRIDDLPGEKTTFFRFGDFAGVICIKL